MQPAALVYNPMLPPGWIEHRTPTGQPYWYNTVTKQSSWLFPSPLPPLQPKQEQKKKKKQIKKKIPGTHWLFVLTHDGYEFFYDRETKTSVWEMPEDLKEPMEELRKTEEEEKKRKQQEEEEEEKKKKQQEEEEEEKQNKKRALQEQEAELEAKRVRLEQEIVQTDENKTSEHAAEEALEATEMTEEDIMWQLQQMEGDQQGEEREQKEPQQEEEEEEKKEKEPPVEEKPTMSEQECIAKFNELLAEKNISPFAVYATEYPKLMTDPRFSLVPPKKQKALFNKYCNELSDKIKREKMNKKTPQDEFKELLVEQVTKKMYWDDFRRKFKDDPRFKALSATREREALFKDHVKHHLGKKSLPRDEYMDLLRDTKEIRVGIRWRDAKKILERDDRYHAIESKTEREDLFRDYLESCNKET